MDANDIYEAFRKALVETFIPEIRQLRESIDQLREEMRQQNAQLREDMKEIKGALNVVLHRLDIADRVAKLEGQVDFLLKKAS